MDYQFKSLVFNIAAGYEFNIQGRTNFRDMENACLTDKSKEEGLINWTGARVGMGVGFVFLNHLLLFPNLY